MLEKEDIPVDKKYVPIEDFVGTQNTFLDLKADVEDLNRRLCRQPWDLCLLDPNPETRLQS